MEVAALNYGVRWLPARHPIRWAADVFPAEVEVPGWRLQLTETRLEAWPGDRFYDEGAARADLEPLCTVLPGQPLKIVVGQNPGQPYLLQLRAPRNAP